MSDQDAQLIKNVFRNFSRLYMEDSIENQIMDFDGSDEKQVVCFVNLANINPTNKSQGHALINALAYYLSEGKIEHQVNDLRTLLTLTVPATAATVKKLDAILQKATIEECTRILDFALKQVSEKLRPVFPGRQLHELTKLFWKISGKLLGAHHSVKASTSPDFKSRGPSKSATSRTPKPQDHQPG